MNFDAVGIVSSPSKVIPNGVAFRLELPRYRHILVTTLLTRGLELETVRGVLEFLKDYRETLTCKAPGDWVFQGARAGLRLTTIANPLRATFKWSGLYEKGKLAHTLRHSVATELLASGVDLETVRDVLGHSNVTTTALYLHAVDERKRRAARQLKLV
jgi:site-specific recombinase XerD